ncbi:methyltransferase domain-containing protein [candidate division WOR-3 bacterium]|uniref:Methyltransferase domain-containing protein n=1 Tax=candidate division WOR-3 bacterium TaxID=2052148 RepID=A0A9D5KB53_UNCW3|nr:methyltransferase domain-containing protein [candidate division WOR-3 bacterium]MBD3365480.1 methyltransferase domain-containing protein [candidate division WOR-3 bacterium]
MGFDVTEILKQVACKYSQPEEVAEMNRVFMEGSGLLPVEQTLVGLYFPYPCRVLVIGCGVGRESVALAKQGYRVTGVDITKRLIAEARRNAISENANVTFLETDGHHLEMEERSFDLVVIFSQAVEHIPTSKARIELLKGVRNVLVPNGFLFITAHDRYHPTMSRLRPVFEVITESWAEEGDVFLSNVQGIESEGKAFMHYSKPDEMRTELAEAGFNVWQFARHSQLGGDPDLDRLFYMVCSSQSLESTL